MWTKKYLIRLNVFMLTACNGNSGNFNNLSKNDNSAKIRTTTTF